MLIDEDGGFVWENILTQAAIIGISYRDLFDMEYWQFVCYMEGYRRRQIQNDINSIINAVRIGKYVGKYTLNNKAPDAEKLISMLEDEMNNKITKTNEDEESDEEKIDRLKQNLARFD